MLLDFKYACRQIAKNRGFAAFVVLTLALGIGACTAEIGIRMVLGARPIDVTSLILRYGYLYVGLGLLAGLFATLAGGRLIASMLFETSSRDPLVLASVVAVFLVVTASACLVPALRATRIDPMAALRAE